MAESLIRMPYRVFRRPQHPVNVYEPLNPQYLIPVDPPVKIQPFLENPR